MKISGMLFGYVDIYISESKKMIKTNVPLQKAAEIIRVLGHPARIEILILLKNVYIKRMTVTQIHEALGLSQPETSRHLSLMKNSFVLKSEKEGSHSYYFINEEHSFVRSITNSISKFQYQS